MFESIAESFAVPAAAESGAEQGERPGPRRRERQTPAPGRPRSRHDRVARDLLEQIATAESAIRRLQAVQVRAVAAYAARQRGRVAEIDAELGGRAGPDGAELCERAIGLEVAAGFGVSAASARLLVTDAVDLVGHHPVVLDTLAAGRVSLFTARQIAAGTRVLDAATAASIDAVVAEEATQLLPGQVRGMVEARVIEADPDAAAGRAAIARDEAAVTFRPEPDAVATLTARLPAEQALACYQAIDGQARALRAAGDRRTLARLRCDTLVERLTGTGTAADGATVEVQLVMTDQTLLGRRDAPADLAGYGPIPAGLARDLSTKSRTWLRRLLTDPIDATVTSIDTRRRRFDGAVGTFIGLRDRRCRNPVCHAAIADLDHRLDKAKGGATDAPNGNGYCQRCHHLKDHPGISVTAIPASDPETNTAHGIVWTGPSGNAYPSLAPPALGHGTATLDQIRYRSRLLRDFERISPSAPDRGG